MDAQPAQASNGDVEHNLALHGLLLGFWMTGGAERVLAGKVVRAAAEGPCCQTAVLRAQQVARRAGLGDVVPAPALPAAGQPEPRPRHDAQALVLTPDGADALCVGVVVRAGAGGGVTPLDATDPVMRAAAEAVLGRFPAARQGLLWRLEWPLQGVGQALGLPLHVAGLVALHGLAADPLLGAAGPVDPDGRVGSVPGVVAMLEAAADVRLERVLLPAATRRAADAARVRAPRLGALDVLYVDHVDEVADMLAGELRLVGSEA